MEPPRHSGFARPVEQLGRAVLSTVEGVGNFALMGFEVTRWSVRRPFRLWNLLFQMDFVGAGSVLIVALTGLFTGMVFAHQSARAFEVFNAQSMIGPTVALTLTRELSPVFSALMVTMRAVSAMCTELGTMRVTEQIDALETMAVNPVQYLIVPRVLAGLVAVPLLSMMFTATGFAGAYFVAVVVRDVSAGTFLTRTEQWVGAQDLVEGLVKAAVFGLAVTLIGCYKGFKASGGAKGVGQATTQAMVGSALSVFILDYVVGIVLH